MMSEARRKIHTHGLRWMVCSAVFCAAGCAAVAPPKPAPAPAPIPKPAPDHGAPQASKPVPPAGVPGAAFRRTTWRDVSGWREENPARAWEAFLAGCSAMREKPSWTGPCAAALSIGNPDRDAARRFFESNFTPYQVVNPDGSAEGLVTGYYEPLLHGSRTASDRYRYPVYGVPDDLIVIDLAQLHPELKGMHLRGRLEGRRVVPYYDRARIESGEAAVRGKEIAWVDDAIELFFLQIQGSGRILLDDGTAIRVGYADQNGYPYRSIGRWLVEHGELTLEQASLQGIKDWARRNPDRLAQLLNTNARYIFFRELPQESSGPIGTLGVPLTARRSVAVDPSIVPLGAPVFLATTWPNSSRPLQRLMLAQDTGSAIRGAVRADFFWGFGEEAAREAGRMRQPLRMWVLLPNGGPSPPQ